MNYHNAMMNIKELRLESTFHDTVDHHLYKKGHRDARHAAAELAIQADNRIEDLEKALQSLVDANSFSDVILARHRAIDILCIP